MPYWVTRSNLSAAQFPFATPWMGRSVIVRQFDQNVDTSVLSAPGDSADKGLPQAFYMQNCLPTAQGYQSIAYNLQLAAAPYAAPVFDKAFLLRNTIEDRFVYSPGVGATITVQNNIFDPYIGEWRQYPSVAAVSLPLVTTAYIDNRTFIFIEGTGCFEYDKAVPGLAAVVLGGLTIADILGITAANGYLIAWSKTGIFWSSTVDPTDFVPSLQTGAGFGDVNDIKGPITFCIQISGGFIVYTERNVVAANYSGNIRYPFSFKEVVNSGGVQSIENVTSDSSTAEHYALTTSGLQKIDRQVAANISPELTDFLTSDIFETFDPITITFTTEYLTEQVISKIAICANRYLIISYGKISLTHALVYDITTKRWGKLMIDHVDCFDYFGPEKVATPITDDMKGSVGFLQTDGTVKTVNFASGVADSSGVLVLGKFQFTRSSVIQLQRFNFEAANPNGAFSVYVLPSLDGTNFQPAVVPTVLTSSGRLREYGCRVTGENISLAVIGSFNLVSNEIEFLKGGSR